MMLDQAVIFTLGVAAIYLANDPRPKVRRWGCICGLLAQPFWFYTTFVHAQWGIFASSFLYTYSWGRGFYFYWLQRA